MTIETAREAEVRFQKLLKRCPEEIKPFLKTYSEVFRESMEQEFGYNIMEISTKVKSLEAKVRSLLNPRDCPSCGCSIILMVVKPAKDLGKHYCPECRHIW